MNKILIIDGSSLFFRAFYALPLLKNKKGMYTNAIYGFISMVENAIDKINPDYIAVCFDKKGRTFRHEIYKDYKGTRQKTPSELEQQWPLVRKILDYMNIVTIDSPVYEADDIAGTLAQKASEKNFEVYLLTGDKDYFQLVDKNTKVLLTRKGISDIDIVDEEYLKEKYNLRANQFIDLKGLMGDSSDNIPGVPGVGEKTGLKLLYDFENLEGVYENLDQVSGKKLKEKLEENKAQAFMSKKLGTIIRNVPIEKNLEDFEKKDYNFEELLKLYKDLDFNTLLKRLPEEYQKEKTETVHEDIFERGNYGLEKLLEASQEEQILFFKIITDGKIYEGTEPIKFVLGSEKLKPIIIDYNKENLNLLKKVFEDGKIKKISYDIKEDIIILLYNKIDIKNIYHDNLVAEYILDSTKTDFDINTISGEYFSKGYKSDEELLGKGKLRKKYEDLSLEELEKYFAFYLNTIKKIYKLQIEKIENYKMTDLYYNMELPLTEVLASMELTGIRTEESILNEIGKDLEIKLKKLEEKIYEEAGEEFNINSPKQLGEILFDKLKFPVIKKTKTGYSTSAEVLEKLVGQGDIVIDVLEYRKLSKLKSTYVDGLIELINKKTGRIHSHFNQTVTSTGRLSSTEPNLQNIPIRSEEGRLLRKAFLASKDSLLVDCDYSQIELRILASLSEDENMVKAFKNGMDIHSKTASEVFGVDIEKVTREERSRAKAVNFGIVYGISDYGLSRQLNIPRNLAKEYIDGYWEKFPKVKAYMEEEIKNGKEKGFVKTIFNRRRDIPELKAKNFNIRQFGERIALNTPIQGSAADIIKIAMVKVYKALKDKKMKSKLILTIHDELVVDAKKEELDQVKKLMVEIMESAKELKVPLTVDQEVGESLYDTK